MAIPLLMNLTSLFQKPAGGGNFELKQNMVQLLINIRHFIGLSHEDPQVHLWNFLVISDTFIHITMLGWHFYHFHYWGKQRSGWTWAENFNLNLGWLRPKIPHSILSIWQDCETAQWDYELQTEARWEFISCVAEVQSSSLELYTSSTFQWGTSSHFCWVTWSQHKKFSRFSCRCLSIKIDVWWVIHVVELNCTRQSWVAFWAIKCSKEGYRYVGDGPFYCYINLYWFTTKLVNYSAQQYKIGGYITFINN